MRGRLPALLSLLAGGSLLASCGGIDHIEDYFSTTAAEVLFVGVADDETTELLADLGLEGALGAGATAMAFLAQATSLSSVAANLVDDADRVLIHDGSRSTELVSQGNGLYLVDSEDDGGLVYAAGTTYTFQAVKDGRAHTSSMLAPGPPVLTGIPQGDDRHPRGSTLTVGLGGQFDNAIVVVVDATGNITYDNRPRSASDYVSWIQDESMENSVTIPGTAFGEPGAMYLIGVAGVREALDTSYENLNPLVSNFATGSIAIQGLITGS